jgi:hypothetical protein
MIYELFLLALFCNGLQYASAEGYLLYPFYKIAERFPKWIFKPIIGCIYCMASCWGVVIHTAYCYISNCNLPYLLIGYPIVMIGGVFVNGLVKDLIDRINR